MKNFWLETTKNIMHQWNDDEPQLMAANISSFVASMGPTLGTIEWGKPGFSMAWIYDPEGVTSAGSLFAFRYNRESFEEWNWEEAPNASWSDDGKVFTTVLENEGDALIFGNHFMIFIQEEWKNGMI